MAEETNVVPLETKGEREQREHEERLFAELHRRMEKQNIDPHADIPY